MTNSYQIPPALQGRDIATNGVITSRFGMFIRENRFLVFIHHDSKKFFVTQTRTARSYLDIFRVKCKNIALYSDSTSATDFRLSTQFKDWDVYLAPGVGGIYHSLGNQGFKELGRSAKYSRATRRPEDFKLFKVSTPDSPLTRIIYHSRDSTDKEVISAVLANLVSIGTSTIGQARYVKLFSGFVEARKSFLSSKNHKVETIQDNSAYKNKTIPQYGSVTRDLNCQELRSIQERLQSE